VIIPYFGCGSCSSGRGRLIDPRYSELVEALGQEIAQQRLAEQVTHGLPTRVANSRTPFNSASHSASFDKPWRATATTQPRLPLRST
jgi:hypothetical protein